MSPDRRRRVVQLLQQRFGVSQRRACAVVGQHRCTQRRRPRQPRDVETSVRARLRQIARAHPRWGRRKAYWLLRSDGLVVNRKRIRRYWADEGLPRPARVCKRQRIGPQRGDRLAATRPDEVWAGGLPGRRHQRWPTDPVLQRGGRVHPRSAGHRGSPLVHR